MVALVAFASAILAQLERDLAVDAENDSFECQSALTSCGQERMRLLSTVHGQSQDHAKDLSELLSLSHRFMKENRHDYYQCLMWRKLYTDVTLVWSFLDILAAHGSATGEGYWESLIGRLDHAIIVAGAPGDGRFDLVLNTIKRLQDTHLPLFPPDDSVIPRVFEEGSIGDHQILPSASLPIPVLSNPPSLSAFRTTFSHAPFILRRFADDWPAVRERRWASKNYLRRIAGRGRIVPVEIGIDYRTEGWSQRMIEWDALLDYLFTEIEANRGPDKRWQNSKEMMYLAQHDLFKQFPGLREDVIPPDYVYACLPPPEHYPQYRPPANEDELVMNTWIGPSGTISPAHVDPFYNFYSKISKSKDPFIVRKKPDYSIYPAQVVGRKTVWLAPPGVSHILSPRSSSSECRTASDKTSGESMSNGSMLSNTTHLDVFASGSELQSEVETVAPVAMSAVLDEGDMLFFPVGWWHAFRSESTSFSVSMWF